MKYMFWSADKEEWLKANRNLSFEQVVAHIAANGEFKLLRNTSSKHPNQMMIVLKLNGYPHCVPYQEEPNYLLLKTIFPNRKMK